MKVLTVDNTPGRPTITAIIFGKVVTITGKSFEDVAKQAMKQEHYFTRDKEILEDIKQVIQEHEKSDL